MKIKPSSCKSTLFVVTTRVGGDREGFYGGSISEYLEYMGYVHMAHRVEELVLTHDQSGQLGERSERE